MSMTSPSGRGLRLAVNLVLLVVGLLFALPLLWMVLASVDASATLALQAPSLTLDNFAKVLTPDLAGLPLLNSFLLSAGCAVITVALATLAAYPLSRYRTKFNKRFLYTLLFATSLPMTVLMVPVYSLFAQLNLIDSLPGTTLFLAASELPWAIWLMKNFVDSVPTELEEAAWVDGASSMRALWTIIVPLIRPGLAVVGIYVFSHAWGNFFVPYVLLLSQQYQPAAVSIFTFFGEYGAVAYGQLAAYSLVYSAPVLALYAFVWKSLGGGSALAGAMKG
ncbi:carbohydrate ABC transporter permease [Homoserinibacter sp. YIM 151385]|uniref:carbohydrate ABC transporter permease n=1 Tax=Homoserinibacter sp. YIM 151385 TaxID=2985506 RepID=UPI0022F11B87|nr:carbohydrate ABC transporter permease [Homoserinibacter sp. YIM 151385]WBU37533.1 carbohydrate ABC transporter permease [Homoserinibacter sp. YIM 151385]